MSLRSSFSIVRRKFRGPILSLDPKLAEGEILGASHRHRRVLTIRNVAALGHRAAQPLSFSLSLSAEGSCVAVWFSDSREKVQAGQRQCNAVSTKVAVVLTFQSSISGQAVTERKNPVARTL